MASTTFRFLKFGTSRQIFFQILCSKKNFENFFWSDQKTGLTARRVHYGPFRSPRSISGPYQKMTIPLLNSPKPHPLLNSIVYSAHFEIIPVITPRPGCSRSQYLVRILDHLGYLEFFCVMFFLVISWIIPAPRITYYTFYLCSDTKIRFLPGFRIFLVVSSNGRGVLTFLKSDD